MEAIDWIALGGAILVFLIILGVLIVIDKKDEKKNKPGAKQDKRGGF